LALLLAVLTLTSCWARHDDFPAWQADQKADSVADRRGNDGRGADRVADIGKDVSDRKGDQDLDISTTEAVAETTLPEDVETTISGDAEVIPGPDLDVTDVPDISEVESSEVAEVEIPEVWEELEAEVVLCGNGACDDGENCDTCPDDCSLPEICDGHDNDCDGSVDEELGQTTCGLGECLNTVDNCSGGAPQLCEEGTPADEECNGLDDNCNGEVDEGVPGCCLEGEMNECSSNVGECTVGTKTCDAEASWGPCSGVEPVPEECDGKDNDCNGESDEVFPCSPGQKKSQPCESNGTQTSMCGALCEWGGWSACEEPVTCSEGSKEWCTGCQQKTCIDGTSWSDCEPYCSNDWTGDDCHCDSWCQANGDCCANKVEMCGG